MSMSSTENNSNSQSGKPVGANDFVTEAYNAEGEEGLKKFYAKWAEDYDRQMLENLNYASPRLVAQTLEKFLDNREARILDIGCGTGLTADALHTKGYNNLYGIDLSQDMVDMAESRGIYIGLKAGDVTRPLDYENDYFDGAISSGTFTHGHVDASCLPEIFRIIKPGGVLACTVKAAIWEKSGFESMFSRLAESGQIQCLGRHSDKFYDDEPPAGWFCAYQKMQS